MEHKVLKSENHRIRDELFALTVSFCKEYLDDEYADLCFRVIDKMSRKRQIPYLSGRLSIWAGAIIHALGTINFLFDRSTQPYVNATQISEYFGASASTVGQKSKVIRDMFKMSHWDLTFSTKRLLEKNPYANLALIGGFLMRTHEH